MGVSFGLPPAWLQLEVDRNIERRCQASSALCCPQRPEVYMILGQGVGVDVLGSSVCRTEHVSSLLLCSQKEY